MLSSTAGAQLRTPTASLWVKFSALGTEQMLGPIPLNNFLLLYYTDWTGFFKADNKIHKPLHPQAHKADWPFLKFSL